MGKKVIIPEQVSAYVERLFFEYNARLNVFKFLIKDNDIEQNILDKYQKEIENQLQLYSSFLLFYYLYIYYRKIF